MKVTRNLEISSQEFFETMFLNLAEEIRTSLKTEVNIADFKTGYRHIYHPEDPALKITFEIVEYQEDKLYKAVRTSAHGTTTICYDVAESDAGISVTFTYDSTSDGQKKKRGIWGSFTEIMMLGRMTDALYGIQKDAINRRDGFIERRTSNPLRPVKRQKTDES